MNGVPRSTLVKSFGVAAIVVSGVALVAGQQTSTPVYTAAQATAAC